MEETYTKSFPCTLIGRLSAPDEFTGIWKDFDGQASTVEVEWQDCGDSCPYTVTLNDDRICSSYRSDATEGEHYRIDPEVWVRIHNWLHELDERKEKEENELRWDPSDEVITNGDKKLRNILREAKAKSQEGMDGNGWFFIE